MPILDLPKNIQFLSKNVLHVDIHGKSMNFVKELFVTIIHNIAKEYIYIYQIYDFFYLVTWQIYDFLNLSHGYFSNLSFMANLWILYSQGKSMNLPNIFFVTRIRMFCNFVYVLFWILNLVYHNLCRSMTFFRLS